VNRFICNNYPLAIDVIVIHESFIDESVALRVGTTIGRLRVRGLL